MIIVYNEADLIPVFIIYTRYSPFNVGLTKRQFGLSNRVLYDQTENNFLKLGRCAVLGFHSNVLLHVFIDGYLPAKMVNEFSALLNRRAG
jgi:hypothetical protein